jgi:hypothetical protein
MLAKARAIAQDVVGEAQPADLTGEEGSQPFLALEEGQPGGVLAVQEQEVEGHEHQGIGAALVHGGLQAAERRNTVRTKGAQFTIEISRLHGQRLKRLDGEAVLLRPVQAGAGEQLGLSAVQPRAHPITVVLNFI